MSASLRALLTGLIDYAGLFPPAKLPMEPAIRNYSRFVGEPEHWMLGRFVCPAARLAELSEFVDELFTAQSPLVVSALGRSGPHFEADLRQDLVDIDAFRRRHPRNVGVDVFETRLPDVPTVAECGHRLEGVKQQLEFGLMTYFEATPRHVAGGIAVAVTLIVSPARGPTAGSGRIGFKLRCGGLDAAAFPPSEQIAEAIVACHGERLPIKFTAGLHHPTRRFASEVETTMHGFLNVFVAGVFAAAGKETVNQILDDEDPASFAFDDAGLSWRQLRATTKEVEAARHRVISFGSCSFDEPRDDLRALGLLP